jgi:predicted RNase H-like nuclease
MKVIGIDGCKYGWVCAIVSDGESWEIELYKTLEDVLRKYPTEQKFIDIPIGLVDSGDRVCDTEAKTLLGTAHMSIFHPPVNCLLKHYSTLTDELGYMDKFRKTNEYALLKNHNRLSIFAFGIIKKILEASNTLKEHSGNNFQEFHPELLYRQLNPNLAKKKEALGLKQRIRLMQSINEAITEKSIMAYFGTKWFLKKHVEPNDIVDALIAPVLYFASGGDYEVLGDSKGEPCTIAYFPRAKAKL